MLKSSKFDYSAHVTKKKTVDFFEFRCTFHKSGTVQIYAAMRSHCGLSSLHTEYEQYDWSHKGSIIVRSELREIEFANLSSFPHQAGFSLITITNPRYR